MKTISLTNNTDYEIEEWVDKIINELPEDVATWCFSSLLVCPKPIRTKECHSVLRKAWEEIPVYIVSSDMSGQSVKKASGEFLIPSSNERHVEMSNKRFDGKLLEHMLTNVDRYTDGALWPGCIESSKKGNRLWQTYNRYSVYEREFPYLRAYDKKGTQPRVFVWADKIKNDYPDDYNSVVALTILCSKIEAFMDFDMFGNSYKIERSHSLQLVMDEYYRLKTHGLAFGWSLYLLSQEFPDVWEEKFCESLCNCDIYHKLGKAYVHLETHYLFEGTRMWIDTKRKLCFGPINCLSAFDDYTITGNNITNIANDWVRTFHKYKAILENKMHQLLNYDYQANDYSDKLRSEKYGGFNNLATIRVPSAVVELRAFMFENARPASIYLHSGIRYIDENAFSFCDAFVHKPEK